jgi:RecA-family ATPase
MSAEAKFWDQDLDLHKEAETERARHEPPPEPLHVVDPAEWQDKPVPERRWIVPDWIPYGFATGLYGPPGEGKTLIIQQLATARALGKLWLGCPVHPGKTILFLCEDDEDELHRRQAAINTFYDCSYSDLAQRIRFVPRLGYDNTLMTFQDGRSRLTSFYQQAVEEALSFGADLVIFDTVADTFGGNQNDAGQVRQFVQFGLASVARIIGGATLASAHPSQQGRNTGTGESGSVQWEAAFRSRAYLSHPKAEDETADDNARVLTRKKANYAPRDETIDLVWKDGVFVAPRAPTGIFNYIERKTCERVVLELVEKTAQENQWVSINNRAGNYAPRVFVRRPENQQHGYKVGDFERTIQDLLARRELVNQPYGRNGDERYRLALANGHAS